MSALLGYGWMDRTAYWAWVAGMVMGGFLGVLLGQWMVWLLLRNPLGLLLRAGRKVRRRSPAGRGARPRPVQPPR